MSFNTKHRACVWTAVAAMILMICFLSASAIAETDWNQFLVVAEYSDASGFAQQVYAAQTPWGTQSFWMTLPGDAVYSQIKLSFSHPNHPNYQYSINEMDIDSLLDGSQLQYGPVKLNVFASDDQSNDFFTVFVSLEELPLEDPTAVPVATEEPVQVTTAQVIVSEQTVDGDVLNHYLFEVPANQSMEIRASTYDDYQVVGDSSIIVTADASGTADKSEIVFLYEKSSTETFVPSVRIMVIEQIVAGDILNSYTLEVPAGQSTEVTAGSYEHVRIIGESTITVTVNERGEATPSQVVFTYELIPVSPATVQVIEQTITGEILNTYSVEIPAGQSLSVSATTYEGFRIIGAEKTEVSVDAEGAATPDQVVFTYEMIPAQTAVPTAQVLVSEQTADSTLLNSYTVEIPAGQTIEITASQVEGYQVVGTSSVKVTAGDDGTTTPSMVNFVYELIPVQTAAPAARVVVVEQTSGGDILNTFPVEIPAGQSKTITASVYEQYQVIGSNRIEVSVNADGTANPSQVIFTYDLIPAQTTAPTVLVNVVEQTSDGDVLNSFSVEIPAGQSVEISATEHEGYQVIGDESTEVFADYDGVASPEQVVFYYETVAPASPIPAVKVSVVEQTVDGDVMNIYVVEVEAGQSKEITARPYDDYQIIGADNVTVTVDAEGKASVSQIVFTYELILPETIVSTNASPAEVTVLYWFGDSLLGSDKLTINPASSIPILAKAFDGYQLVDDQDTVIVTVDENGTPSQATVEFHYREKTEAISVLVPIVFRNVAGMDLITPYFAEVMTGSSVVIQPDISYLPEGFDPNTANPASVKVQIDDKGLADPAQIVFTFKRSTDPAETPLPAAGWIERWAVVTTDKSNIRREPSRDGKGIAQVTAGTNLWAVEAIETSGKGNEQYWTRIIYQGQEAYIRSDLISVLSQAESDDIQDASESPMPVIGKPTPVPTASPTPDPTSTPEPTATPEPVFVQVPVEYRTVGGQILNSDTLSLQTGTTTTLTPNASMVPAGFDMSLTAAVRVYVNERGVSDPQIVVFTLKRQADASETPLPNVGWIERWAKAVKSSNIRSEPSTGSKKLGSIKENELIWAIESVETKRSGNDRYWTKILYKGKNAYIRSDLIHILSQAESDDQQEMINTPVPLVGPTSTQVPEAAVASTPVVEQVPDETEQPPIETPVPTAHVSEITDPPAPIAAPVDVIYQTVGGQTIYEYSQIISGQTVIRPDGSILPEEYDIFSADPAEYIVNVNRAGMVTREQVIFTFKRAVNPEETPIPSNAVVNRWALTNVSGTNVRKEAKSSSGRVATISKKNTAVWVQETVLSKNDTWAHVIYNGKQGYIQSKYLDIMSEAASLDYQDLESITPGPVLVNATPDPTAVVTEQLSTPVITALPDPTLDPYDDFDYGDDIDSYDPTEAVPVYQGYFVTVGNNIPLRSQYDDRSVLLAQLPKDTVVFVTNQVLAQDNWTWHTVNYNGMVGYIRSDMLRMMSQDEIETMMANAKATKTPDTVITPVPYTVDADSSYGYIYASNGGSVNIRNEANGNKVIGKLKNYALALILEETEANAKTWYHIYNETTGLEGYVSGDFLKPMSIREFNTYMTDGSYEKGVANNSKPNSSQATSAPYSSLESQYAADWQQNNSGVSYATWVPPTARPTIAPTPEPVVETSIPVVVAVSTEEIPTPTVQPDFGGSNTFEPYTGNVEENRDDAEPVFSPETTVSTEPVDVEMNSEDGSGKGSNLGVVLLATAGVILAGGGAYAYTTVRRNRKRAAARAAKRRAMASGSGTAAKSAANPDAVRPRTGTYPKAGISPMNKTTGTSAASSAARPITGSRTSPTSTAAGKPDPSMYAKPTGEADATPTASAPRAPLYGSAAGLGSHFAPESSGRVPAEKNDAGISKPSDSDRSGRTRRGDRYKVE